MRSWRRAAGKRKTISTGWNLPSRRKSCRKHSAWTMGSIQEDVHLKWVELLAYLGAKYGGDFERFRQADLDAVTEKLKSGMTMEELTKDMKYYAYYREAYGAVLDGMVGYFEQETEAPEDLTQSRTG